MNGVALTTANRRRPKGASPRARVQQRQPTPILLLRLSSSLAVTTGSACGTVRLRLPLAAREGDVTRDVNRHHRQM